jgi:hypothetical protein
MACQAGKVVRIKNPNKTSSQLNIIFAKPLIRAVFYYCELHKSPDQSPRLSLFPPACLDNYPKTTPYNADVSKLSYSNSKFDVYN